jgi:hypothetical protein
MIYPYFIAFLVNASSKHMVLKSGNLLRVQSKRIVDDTESHVLLNISVGPKASYVRTLTVECGVGVKITSGNSKISHMEFVEAEVSNDFVLIVIVESERLASELFAIMRSNLPKVAREFVVVCSAINTEFLKSKAVGEDLGDLKKIAEDMLVSQLAIIKVVGGKSRDWIWQLGCRKVLDSIIVTRARSAS